MTKKKNIFKELHQLKREEKEIHGKEVKEIVKETYHNQTIKL